MTDGSDLLAAVLANPADDNVRLVYADWLQEQGDDARAEFIRVQVELARTPAHLGVGTPIYRDVRTGFYGSMPLDRVLVGFSEGLLPNPRHVELAERERKLLGAHGYGWCDGTVGPDAKTRVLDTPAPRVMVDFLFRNGTGTNVMWLTFRRGFVSQVELPARSWIAHADAITTAHPIERVALTTVPEIDGELAWRGGDFGTGIVEFLFGGDTKVVAMPVVARGYRTEMAFADGLGGPLYATDMLAARWPGITFTVPMVPNLELFENYRDELFEQIAQGLGVPPHTAGALDIMPN